MQVAAIVLAQVWPMEEQAMYYSKKSVAQEVAAAATAAGLEIPEEVGSSDY